MRCATRAGALALVLAAGLAGCGGGSVPLAAATTTPTPTASSTASEEPTVSPTPSGTPGGRLPTPLASAARSSLTPRPSTTAGPTTISGTVEAGVEAGCLVLLSDGVLYQLVGGDTAALAPGAVVEVGGATAEGLMTTCQQGVPFRVASVTARS